MNLSLRGLVGANNLFGVEVLETFNQLVVDTLTKKRSFMFFYRHDISVISKFRSPKGSFVDFCQLVFLDFQT